MAELSGLDRLWLGLLRAPLSWWARPHVLPDDLRRRYAQHDRPICYVLDVLGVADLVALEKTCARHGLPEPLDGLKPPLPSRSVLFLERRTGFWGDRIDHRISAPMRQLVAAAANDRSLEVDLIPVTVMWGRAPDREGSWLRVLLSENWERVGRFRRFLSVVVNGRNLFVQFGDPVSLRAALDDGADAARAVRRLTRTLRVALARQRAAAIGPDLSHRRTIVTQVLRAGAVRRAMAEEMRSKKISRREASEAGTGLRRGDCRELLARFHRDHGAHADVVLDAPVRRRGAASLRSAAEAGGRQRDRLRAVPPQSHRLHAAVLRDLLQGIRRAARRGRRQSQHAGARPLHPQGRRLLHSPQLQGQHAVHDGVHEVPRPDDGARPLDRVLHRRRPQPHRATAAAEDRHAVDDVAQLPARSAPTSGVPARVFRLRAPRRRQDVHRRAVGQGERERVGVHAAAHAAGAAPALRQSARELRRSGASR